MGTTEADFQSCGKVPCLREASNRSVKAGASSYAKSLRMKGGRPSGPVALNGFRLLGSLWTPLIEKVRLSMSGDAFSLKKWLAVVGADQTEEN